MQESEKVTRRRKTSSKMMKVLREADDLVSDIAIGKEL